MIDFDEALQQFESTCTARSVTDQVDLGIRLVEAFNQQVRRFGAEQQKAGLDLAEHTDVLHELAEKQQQATQMQQRLNEADDRQDQLVRVLIQLADQFENLYRFYEHKQQEAAYQQLQLTWHNLRTILAAAGLTLLDQAGVPYQAQLHHVEHTAVDEAQPAGTVLSVLRSGYICRDKVWRRAHIVLNRPAQGHDQTDQPATDHLPL